ncbi:hypothetical protein RB195_020008 [Necator americanus]|uniref:Uncharacterized protein n=1 Tax=Necator americanus TaxID=51031 RepID=A0ABR1CHE3_NECAM
MTIDVNETESTDFLKISRLASDGSLIPILRSALVGMPLLKLRPARCPLCKGYSIVLRRKYMEVLLNRGIEWKCGDRLILCKVSQKIQKVGQNYVQRRHTSAKMQAFVRR